tara:strand:+ start:147 stop:1046 length:900 start_codon:yes stop_codon:yes gene_type:complete
MLKIYYVNLDSKILIMKKLFYLIAFIPTLLFAQIIQDPCTLSPDPGPCMAAVPKYYFNQETQQCTMFTWGGCAGIVPFNTLSECEAAACTNTTVDSCNAIPIEGCFSISIWAPVCGCDGVTYSNASEAACNTIYNFTFGECGSTNDILGCTDDSALNYNPFATVDDNSCIYLENILGCMDVTACNYNPEANLPNFTCEFADEFYDCDGSCLSDTDSDGVCDGIDNCISIYNFEQLDTDSDGEGDICDFDDNMDLKESKSNISPLIKMVDVLGREFTSHPKGKILFYIYQDNSVEKRVIY